MYRDGKFPTLDPNQRNKFRAMAPHILGDVLDLGCGECGLASVLNLHGRRYTGIDYGEPTLRPEVTIPDDCTFSLVYGDLLEVEYPEADTVCLIDVVEHFDDPSVLIEKAAAAARKRIVICLPIAGLFTREQNRGEHFWDYAHDETRALWAAYGEVLGPFAASCLCEFWIVVKR